MVTLRGAWPQLAIRAAAAGAVAVVVLLAAVQPATAHSFLVSTTPAQGQRLPAAPSELVLRFSERVDLASVKVRMRTVTGAEVETGRPQLASDGVEVTVPVAQAGEAVYLVGWEGFSAVDGHGSSGEFAFAAGDARGSLPASRSDALTNLRGVMASWVFFVGFALAAGALVVRGLAGASAGGPGRAVVRVGLFAAMAGGVLALPGTPEGWPQVALLSVVQLLAVALVLVAVAARWWAPLTAVLGAAGAWAARSHAAAEHSVLGWLIDAVHLAAGGIWLGSLAVVGVLVWRRAGGERWALVRRYARLALALVVVLAAAGIGSGLALVPSWDALFGTGYGRLVVLKVALLAGALALAAGSRWWALRRAKAGPLRWLMAFETGVVVVALAVAAVLANGAPPQPAVAAEQLLGPPPMTATVTRDAGLAGQLNTEVVADGTRLDIVVFSPSGPVPGTEVEATLRRPDGATLDLVPRPCGTGCYTQALPLRAGATTVTVTATAPTWTGGRFVARLTWPPGEPGQAQLAELVARMRAIPTLTMTETVDSGPGSTVTPARYDFSGEALMAAEPYAAANVEEARFFAGPPPRLVLSLPGSQMFVDLELDAAGRIARSRLVSRGHDILREFTYPD